MKKKYYRDLLLNFRPDFRQTISFFTRMGFMDSVISSVVNQSKELRLEEPDWGPKQYRL